ncbi:MAG: hypothetical protein K2Q01_07775 [Rickettsiales bacterium]|nr:hypothetical protein [Rickettsiales bacterium]
MSRLALALCLLALSACSGSPSDIVGGKYRFRCWAACVDQTSTQNDYVEMRDHCRELAQLKVDMSMKEGGIYGDDKSRKSTLVSLFSQCMSSNGWTVPDGKDPSKAGTAVAGGGGPQTVSQTAALAAAPASAAVAAATKREEQALLTRTSECGFARANAGVSSISATRAKACDLECEKALAVAPSGPRPASCPALTPPKYSKGGVD